MENEEVLFFMIEHGREPCPMEYVSGKLTRCPHSSQIDPPISSDCEKCLVKYLREQKNTSEILFRNAVEYLPVHGIHDDKEETNA